MVASYELSGSVSDKEKSFIETWENVSDGVNYIIRENRRGDEQYEQVIGPRMFKLSTYDRMLTEDKIVDVRNNPFKNGCFRPVTVPEDVTVESNPNAMSSDEIRRLFKAGDAAWSANLDVIDSPATLRRMLDLADGDTGLSHGRFQVLEGMLAKFSSVGKQVLIQKDQAQYDSLAGSVPAAKSTRGRPVRAS